MWAILSGIEGNLTAYEAVLQDINSLSVNVENLYILGDCVGLHSDTPKLIDRLRQPHHQLQPQICRGWWEEQCLILHGFSGTSEPKELMEKFGAAAAKQLWDNVDRQAVAWMRDLTFGFVELDCLLIHGSSVDVGEELTPKTSPWVILDRLQRMDVNQLFCGRSGQTFEYELQQAALNSTVTTLDSHQSTQTLTTHQKRLIGVGNVGKIPHQATYTLYNPYNNHLECRTVNY